MDNYFVVMGAQLKCSEGLINSPFVALNPLWDIAGKFVGRQTDFIPLLNILPFGPTCKLLTKAAGGTPVPCVPFPLPWQGAHAGGHGMLLPVLLDSSTCRCTFGGGIEVADPGQDVVSYDGPVAPAPPAPPLPANVVVYRPQEGITAAEQQLNSPATLPANTLFLVGDFLYVTDAHGKVVQAKGVLPPPPSTAEREAFAQQESVRYKDGRANPRYVADPRTKDQRRKTHPAHVPDRRTPAQKRQFVDDGGHIFGSRFGGSGLHINYVPMHKNQNQPNVSGGNWFAMEEMQADALASSQHVYAEYDFEYPPAEPGTRKFGGYKKTAKRDFSMRPTTLHTKTWIDGIDVKTPYPNS